MNLLNGMQLFVKSVETGNFSKLGRQIHMAPSSISRQISALEDKLGVRLLQRSTRNISLTEAGQIYYQRASKILIDIEQAQYAVTQLQANPEGSLRLNVAVPFGEMHIVPLIPKFLEKYPNVKIDLTLEDRTVDLVEERVDLSIRIGRLDDSSLVARKLAANRYVICASKTYFETSGIPHTPEDLSKHNCIIFKHANIWHLNQGASLHRIPISGNFQANTGGALFSAAKSGIGIAMLPTWLVGRAIQESKLQQVLSDYEPVLANMIDSAVYAIYPASFYLPPKVRVFLDYLVDSFSKNDVLNWKNPG